MFTLKLYSEGRSRIVEAHSFSINRIDRHASMIAVHSGADSVEMLFYVGWPDESEALQEVLLWHERAFIENAAGKTTEVITPPPRQQASCIAEHEWNAQQAYAARLFQPS